MRERLITKLILCICALFIVIIYGKFNIIEHKNIVEEENTDTKRVYNQWEEKGISSNLKNKKLGIIVDVDAKHLYLINLDNNQLVKTYVVATGKSSTPTPLGSYRIIQKAKWGEGFGTRWMKINVPWGTCQ